MAFEGLQVLSLESRRAAEIELLIRKQGGVPFVAPSVKERALAGDSDAFRLLERLESGSCDLLILMTGVGLTFWRDVISAQYSAERADEALRRVKLLVRGPKPTAALRASGTVPDITVPNRTHGGRSSRSSSVPRRMSSIVSDSPVSLCRSTAAEPGIP